MLKYFAIWPSGARRLDEEAGDHGLRNAAAGGTPGRDEDR
jgi:hypothetical protein